MKLVDITANLEQLDDSLTIFLRDLDDSDSEARLLSGEELEVNQLIDGVSYHYLLEVFIAKEVLEGYFESSRAPMSEAEKAKRIYEYGIFDA